MALYTAIAYEKIKKIEKKYGMIRIKKEEHTMNRELIEIFKEIPDPRVGNAKKYKLEEILTIAVLAVLCDCLQSTEMELFELERKE